jgi:error-prone DNA polymerase
MVAGFAGFGFPKAHAAAFGLLAYQSTWLRVHYGPEFLCALLNEQPMGFYAPDSLVHEAQRRGIPVLGLDVNASGVECAVEAVSAQADSDASAPTGLDLPATGLGVRLGLGYIKGAVADEVRELVAERERGGPFRDLGDLAARTATHRATLEQLAWAGACDSLGGSRREALWQLGIASPGEQVDDAVQLALPIDLPDAPRLRPLDRWEALLADYSTSGVTPDDHVMAVLRPRLSIPMLATSAQLPRMPNGCSVAVAGMVIARQRPGTAKGTMFLLFEDEWGTINLIVPGAVYERHRPLARAEPLLLARGRLERSAGVVNVLIRELAPLERYLTEEMAGEGASVSHLPNTTEAATSEEAAEMGADLRAVAPPIQSFASGRRR